MLYVHLNPSVSGFGAIVNHPIQCVGKCLCRILSTVHVFDTDNCVKESGSHSINLKMDLNKRPKFTVII